MTWPTLAIAASFDCAKAATPTERTICGVEKLSILDEKMAKRFSEAKRNDPDNTLPAAGCRSATAAAATKSAC